MKTVAEVLHEAREYLEAHEWIRGNLYDPVTDGVCAVGAIRYSQGWGDGDLDTADSLLFNSTLTTLDKLLPLPGPQRYTAWWNDNHAKSKQEVLDLLAKGEKVALAGFDPDAA